LIVNADDFGLTPGINRAIVELHKAGVLTSTTLMANAGATADAIELALANPSLGVGCHIVLVDGKPVLPPSQVPSLVDPDTQRFPPALTTLLKRLFAGHVRAEELEAEASAQIARLQDCGLRLTHFDTHKHTHMFPAILRPVLRAAKKAGIHRIRNPFEPEWAVRATPRAGWLRSAEVFALRRFGPYFQRLIAQHGFTTTDGTIAVAGTGVFDAQMLGSLISQLPAGTWELVTHPGYNDADLDKVHTRLRASRDIERIALAGLKEFPALTLVSFADLDLTPSPSIV
jgi:hopanoid biosynthesis associated protein HpnK